jgi:multidrug resistance efflux pump
MEILVTIAYVFLVRLVFFDYKLLRFTLAWKFAVFGLYAAAALTEIILLGQYDPYSKELVAESYVVQMAPEFGGIVQEVHAEENAPVKRGSPLFSMDPAQWQSRLEESQALYDLAKDEFDRVRRAGAGAVSQEEIVASRDRMEQARGKVEQAQYNVDHTTIVAPSDGYAVNVQLRPGAFIRIKQPVLSFVSTEDEYLLAAVNQKAARFVEPGDQAEVAFNLYPGKVFPAVVENIVWARGRAQLTASGELPVATTLPGVGSRDLFAVRLRLKEPDPKYPVRFGAIGLAAIYTGEGADVFRLLRQLEIRSESWLNYLYNPF